MTTRSRGVLETTFGGTDTFTPRGPVPSYSRKALIPRIPLAWPDGLLQGALTAPSNSPAPAVNPSATPPGPSDGCGCA